jgi:PTH1 family peptidyl-tRNA hydrolase
VERDWVSGLTDAIADNADLLAKRDEAGFKNKVHMALDAKGLAAPRRPGERAEE